MAFVSRPNVGNIYPKTESKAQRVGLILVKLSLNTRVSLLNRYQPVEYSAATETITVLLGMNIFTRNIPFVTVGGVRMRLNCSFLYVCPVRWKKVDVKVLI